MLADVRLKEFAGTQSTGVGRTEIYIGEVVRVRPLFGARHILPLHPPVNFFVSEGLMWNCQSVDKRNQGDVRLMLPEKLDVVTA